MGEGLGTLVSPALSLPRHKKPSVAEVPTGEAAGTHSQAVRVADTLLWGCAALTTSPGTAQGWNHFPPAGGCSCSTPQLGVLLSHQLFSLQGHPTPHPQQQKLFQPLPHTQHQQQPQELE